MYKRQRFDVVFVFLNGFLNTECPYSNGYGMRVCVVGVAGGRGLALGFKFCVGISCLLYTSTVLFLLVFFFNFT